MNDRAPHAAGDGHLGHRVSAAILVIAGLGLGACGPRSGAVGAIAVDIQVTGDASAALIVHCVAKNVSRRAVYMLDSARMPYLVDDRGRLVVLHGISPPPDDRELNVIEIPTAWTLGPGESFVFDAALVPLRLRDHYGDAPGPRRHGPATVVCRVGFGVTPIDGGARAITVVLAWQSLASSRPMLVSLP